MLIGCCIFSRRAQASKPVTLTSSGRRFPAASKAIITSKATESLPHTKAVTPASTAATSGSRGIANGVYPQSAGAQPAWAKIATVEVKPTNSQLSYTYSLCAHKTGGQESFLIGFGGTGADNYYWWNIGGWGNTQHGVEKRSGANVNLVGAAVKGTVEPNRWYEIKIEVNGSRIRCFLDDKLVHDVQAQAVAEKPA